MEIISDTDRIARMKEGVRAFVESQYPFKRFFPTYGVGRTETKETAVEKEIVEVVTNKEMATTIKATITETVKVEKTVVAEKPLNKRLNKAIKMKNKSGKAVISLHRA